MVKKKGLKKFDISNKLAYTLMVVLSIALLGISVYAWNYVPSNPSVMGHSLNELQVPSGCVAGQVMKLSGGVWACGVDDETDSRFTVTTSGLCYMAPQTCTTQTAYCNNPAVIFNIYPVDYDSQTCLGLTELEMRNYCLAYPTCDTALNGCNGDTTSCPGGTSVSGTPHVEGAVCMGGYIECSCEPPAANTYLKEIVIPAGQRCI